VTFLGQAEEDERKAAMLEHFRKRQRSLGLKPLPRYKSMGLPPVNDKKIKKDTK
jgi:hypothetical protein